jgi:hypothetical protein
VPLSEIVTVVETSRDHSIYHKDLLPVVYVTGDMAGETDSPLYGLFEIAGRLTQELGLEQWFLQAAPNPYEYSLKWDGEWQVTYETFRDMGIAYGVGLILIYLLVVAQFRLPGAPGHHGPHPAHHHRHHAGPRDAGGQVHRHLHDRHDRARRHHRAQLHPAGGLHQPAGAGGPAFEEAVINSAVVRAKPIALTAWPPWPAPSSSSTTRSSRAGGVAALRPLRLHGAHPGGDPGGLLRGDAQARGVDPHRDVG